jgi:transglutaminase superfamily protein
MIDSLWRFALDGWAPPLPVRVALLRVLLPRRLASASMRDLLDDLSKKGSARSDSPEAIEAAVDRLLSQNRFLRTTCLYRALVRYALLVRAGIEVKFVMGVIDGGDDVVGHAWLESGGAPWNEELHHEYRRTFIHP